MGPFTFSDHPMVVINNRRTLTGPSGVNATTHSPSGVRSNAPAPGYTLGGIGAAFYCLPTTAQLPAQMVR